MAVPLRAFSALAGSSLVERPPTPSVASAVVRTWSGHAGRRRTLRMLPDGCADLLWDGTTLTVAGAATTAARYPVAASATVGLRLRPGAVGPLLRVPAHELPAAGVALAAVCGPVAVWESRLADAVDPHAVLEAFVAARLHHGYVPDPRIVHAVRAIAAGVLPFGGVPTAPLRDRSVDAVARDLGIGPRTLRRRFRDDVGHGPKSLQRVLRFRRVLASMDALSTRRLTVADVAARYGYADQAHLCREARTLAGAGPSELVATWVRHAPGG